MKYNNSVRDLVSIDTIIPRGIVKACRFNYDTNEYKILCNDGEIRWFDGQEIEEEYAEMKSDKKGPECQS